MTDAIRTPDALQSGLPESPFEPAYRGYDGLRLAYLDGGADWGGPIGLRFAAEPPLETGNRFAAALGTDVAHVIADASHFLQEDQGPAIGAHIADWLASRP